jgi:hypothetical protein
LFPEPNYHTEFLTFLHSPAPFFSRMPPTSKPLLRAIVHLQTGQCDCQMDSKF